MFFSRENKEEYLNEAIDIINDCTFCNIVKNEMESNKIYEDPDILAFYDAFPISDIHIIIIPKKHIINLNYTKTEDLYVLGRISLVIPKIVKKLEIKNGFKVVINTGKDAGQIINHLHYHILAGDSLETIKI